MKGLIVAGGNGLDKRLLKHLVESCDIIVAADRGYSYLYGIDEKPDYVVGDFDSLNTQLIDKLIADKIELIRHPVEKDKTDTELAIDIMSQLKADEIFLVCGTGNRLDHTLSNIHSLKYIHSLGMRGEIIDDNNIVRYLGVGIMEIPRTPRYISIVALSAEGAEISLTGFHYGLSHQHLDLGRSLGISNYIIDKVGTINNHKGEILVFLSED